jgi:hypothetical protein
MRVSQRWLSAGCYLGLAPLIRFSRSRSADAFVDHHYRQAMAGLFLFGLWFLVVLLLDVLEWIGLMSFPDFGEQHLRRWGAYVGYAAWSLLGAWLLMWMVLAGFALAGSTRALPLVKRLTGHPRILRVAFGANCLVLLLLPLFAVLCFHATTLTRTNRHPAAAVYFLYDEGIPVPRWGYALWMYRVSLQAQRNWGKGSVVLDRLDKETLRTGLAHGRVVILATHGGDGYACTWYAPEKLGVFPPDTRATNQDGPRFLRTSILGPNNQWGEMKSVPVSRDLRLVYMFGCDVGKETSQWQKHLAPAETVTYDRWSTAFDHALWFGLTGPGALKRLR